MRDLQQKLVLIINRSLLHAGTMTVIGPILYSIFIRQRAWTINFWVARFFYTLPKVAKQPGLLPNVLNLLGRFALEAFLLTLSWEFANTVFDLYIAQPPMKQGRVLTEESADPNGSLLNGLRAVRSVPQAFASWELSMISNHMSQRRQVIYQDIARPGGSVWSQLNTICLGELHAVVARIQDANGPTDGVVAAPQQQPQGLPRISNPVKQGDIFTPPKPVKFAGLRGQDPKAYNVVETGTMKAIGYASAHAPKNEQISKDSFSGIVKSSLILFMRSPLGAPFRHTFKRRVSQVVLGSPYSRLSIILDSLSSLTRLVVYSKKEDRFGTVYRDIPNIIRSFTSSHMAIESYVSNLDVHWTDVWFKADDRRVADIQLLLKSLENGIRDMVNEFGEYADDLGLSIAEMRAAKQIVANSEEKAEDTRRVEGGEEMRQLRK